MRDGANPVRATAGQGRPAAETWMWPGFSRAPALFKALVMPKPIVKDLEDLRDWYLAQLAEMLARADDVILNEDVPTRIRSNFATSTDAMRDAALRSVVHLEHMIVELLREDEPPPL